MADDFTTEYDFSDEVSLEPDQKNVGGNKRDWLKMSQKGQIIRGSFVYFHTYDYNSVQKATREGLRSGKKLSREEQIAVAKAALTKRAEGLNKTLDQLTVADKLDSSVAHFKTLKASYQEGIGFVLSRLGKDGSEADAIWKRLPEPKSYFVTLLLVYPTDTEGNLNLEAFASQVKQNKVKLVPWRFGNKIYETIWKLQDGLRADGQSLASKDFKLECDNPQYQGMTVTTAGPATWQKDDRIRNVVLTAAAGMYDKLMPFREMTTEQLRAKLGFSNGGSSGGGDDISSTDFQDMLDSV